MSLQKRETIIVCTSCESRFPERLIVWPIPDVCERVEPGDVMPRGACPDCGELIPGEEVGEE